MQTIRIIGLAAMLLCLFSCDNPSEASAMVPEYLKNANTLKFEVKFLQGGNVIKQYISTESNGEIVFYPNSYGLPDGTMIRKCRTISFMITPIRSDWSSE